MSKLSDAVGRKFVVTGEVAPPKGPGMDGFMHEVTEVKKIYGKIEAVNVVDNPGSILLMSPLAGSIVVKQNGMEPVYQLTCRDRNVLGLESDLLAAAGFGIENVLALTGDHPACRSSDHPKAKPVFDLDSTTLIQTMVKLDQGLDCNGNDLNAETNFFIGAALSPGVDPMEPEAYKTKRKLNAGAMFFQTQAVYDFSVLERFLGFYEKTFGEDIRKRILVGVLPLYSSEMIPFLRTIPGLEIPLEIEERIKKSPDEMGEGVNLALESVDLVRDMGLGGVHVVHGGKAEVMVRVIESI